MGKPSIAACPACSKPISVKAQSCPACGEPLTKSWAKRAARNRQRGHRTKYQSLLVAVVVGTLGPASILYGLASLTLNEPAEAPAAEMAVPPREKTPEEIVEQARQKAREREEAAAKKKEAHLREAQQKAKAFMERVERETASFSKIDLNKYTGSKFGFLAVNALFQVWAGMVEEAKSLVLSSEQQAIVNRFRNGAIRVQEDLLPRIRDAYGPHMRKLLWDKDVAARTFGEGFGTVEFAGALFGANRNIKAFNDELWETFRILRFKQVRYKWFKEATEYTYFNVDGPGDSALVIWGENGVFRTIE